MHSLGIINSLWPIDTIWRHRSGSKLSQQVACCLAVPNHCLNQCWLITKGVLWYSLQSNFTRIVHELNLQHVSRGGICQINTTSPRANDVRWLGMTSTYTEGSETRRGLRHPDRHEKRNAENFATARSQCTAWIFPSRTIGCAIALTPSFKKLFVASILHLNRRVQMTRYRIKITKQSYVRRFPAFNFILRFDMIKWYSEHIRWRDNIKIIILTKFVVIKLAHVCALSNTNRGLTNHQRHLQPVHNSCNTYSFFEDLMPLSQFYKVSFLSTNVMDSTLVWFHSLYISYVRCLWNRLTCILEYEDINCPIISNVSVHTLHYIVHSNEHPYSGQF